MNYFEIIVLFLLAPSVFFSCQKEQEDNVNILKSTDPVEAINILTKKERSLYARLYPSYLGEVVLAKADIYIENCQYESALHNYLIARKSFYQVKNLSLYLQSLIKISYVYSLLSRPCRARHYLEMVYRYADCLDAEHHMLLNQLQQKIYSYNSFAIQNNKGHLLTSSFQEKGCDMTMRLFLYIAMAAILVLFIVSFVFTKHHHLAQVNFSKRNDEQYKSIAREQNAIVYDFVNATLSINYIPIAKKSLKKYMSDKTRFVTITKDSFDFLYPSYMQFLRSKNMSDEEILCCCLFVMGFRGKTIASYFEWSRGYEKFVTIRKKLGIQGMPKNLETFLLLQFKKMGYKSIRHKNNG